MRLSRLLKRPQPQDLAPVVDSSTSGELIAEKRRFQRYESPYNVDMLDARKRSADGAIRLLDMSVFGVGIESSQELAVGQRLGFTMSMDDGFPIPSLHATARVRWSQPWGFTHAYGLELEGLGRLNRWRLARFLRPARFGPLEALGLLLEAATAIVVVLVAADFLASIPGLSWSLFIMMPWIMLACFGLLATYLIGGRY